MRHHVRFHFMQQMLVFARYILFLWSKTAVLFRFNVSTYNVQFLSTLSCIMFHHIITEHNYFVWKQSELYICINNILLEFLELHKSAIVSKIYSHNMYAVRHCIYCYFNNKFAMRNSSWSLKKITYCWFLMFFIPISLFSAFSRESDWCKRCRCVMYAFSVWSLKGIF